jgi:VWFA-related protein
MRRRRRSALALLLFAAVVRADERTPPLLDRVEVSRVMIDARILDGSGRPVLGLKPEHFKVEVDGRPIRLDSVDWIGGGERRDPRPDPEEPTVFLPEDEEGSGAPARLVVFLFQKSLERSRLTGFMKMRTLVAGLVDDLGPDDYAAVLSFDSRLRPHMDFTSDRARLRYVLLNKVLREWPDPLEPGPPPSLLARLSPGEAAAAATPEKALLLIGRALEPLPGAKSIVWVGWGLGRLGGGLFSMDFDYDEARQALSRSRTSVFALDVTEADAHTLELGLQQVAEDTGGFYERAYTTPIAAVSRIAHAISRYSRSTSRPAARAPTRSTSRSSAAKERCSRGMGMSTSVAFRTPSRPSTKSNTPFVAGSAWFPSSVPVPVFQPPLPS